MPRGSPMRRTRRTSNRLRQSCAGTFSPRPRSVRLPGDRPPDETFRQLAYLAWNEEQDVQLQALLEAHAAKEPKSIDLHRFRFRLRIRQNQIADGVALFKKAVALLTTEDQRTTMVSEFLMDMVRAGKMLEGYLAAPDATRAFQILCEDAEEDGIRQTDRRRLIEAHRLRAPQDPLLPLYQGNEFMEDKDWDRAVLVLREGLKKAPKDLQARYRGQLVNALYRAGRWQQAYAENEPRAATFAQLAGLMRNDKKGAELAALVQVHRPHTADEAELLFHEARSRLFLNKPAEAAALLRQACEKQTHPEQQRWQINQVLWDMAAAGHGLQGYRAVPDKRAAFETLANWLINQKKDKELALLIEEHGKRYAQDAHVLYCTGELQLLRGDARLASGSFAAALAKSPAQEKWRYRQGLFRARVRAGQAAATYQEFEPGTATFNSLAALCQREKDVKQLQSLIEVYRQAHADDPNLRGWEIEVNWLSKDYAGVVRQLTERRQELFAVSQFQWKFKDYLVRGLVKTNRIQEAVQEAKTLVKGRTGDQRLLVLAHASAGDVKETIAAVAKGGPQPWFLRSCYQDEDLGALLRSERFREFRDKYPEPKDAPDEDGL